MEAEMRRVLMGLVAALLLAALWRLSPVSAAFEQQVKLTKTDVAAPPEKVFALVEDFRKWGAWSPHERANPAVQRTYSGAARGQGARYEWSGDGIGAGQAQIVESE